jgi:methylthioribose-1-phosphate isomerase
MIFSENRFPLFGIMLIMLAEDRDGQRPKLRRAVGSFVALSRVARRQQAGYVLAMKVNGKATRSIWVEADGASVGIIDQTKLPHRFETLRLATLNDAARAITTMQTRGAPLIGATAAYGMCLALAADPSDAALEAAYATLLATRPTAINLKWALDEMAAAVRNRPRGDRRAAAYARAAEICDEDVAINAAIGRHGLPFIEAAAARKNGAPVNVLTHCNAGWLATVDWGTATAPIYMAHDKGVKIHVWVDETRPRNQGAALTAWELGHHGVPHTVIADNTGGHLMQHGLVDLAIVGTDRVTAAGDVCNKIGTYLKALAARDNGVPFYVALPSPTIDFTVSDGLKEIPIEQRGAEEQATITGRTADGRIETVRVIPEGSAVANYGFDVTPARLVTALITERGAIPATRAALAETFADRVSSARPRERGDPGPPSPSPSSEVRDDGAKASGPPLSRG